MKLSISNIAWDKKNDSEVYRKMKELNFDFLEIAPTRWCSENPYSIVNIEKAKKMSQNLLEEYGIKICSMQSILYGSNEKLFYNNDERESLKNKVKLAINYANIVGCGNIVFGSPRNRKIEDKQKQEEIGVRFFKEISSYAEKKNIYLSIEPNPVIYDTNYINTTEEALDLVNKVGNINFGINYDMGTVLYNNENLNILSENIEKINHIHISEEYLNPVIEREIHKEIKNILVKKNYDRAVSVEMKNTGNINEVFRVMEYISEIFNI